MKNAPQPIRGSRVPARPRLAAALLAVAALLAGCATETYDVKVTAAAKPQPKPSISYRIETHDPSLDPSSLRYQEAVNFIKTALSGKGMYEAPRPELADLVVELDYGISPPIATQRPFTEPVFEDTLPGSSLQTVRSTDYKGNTVYDTVATRDPGHTEFVGDRQYMITVTTYEKRLLLTAHENRESVDGVPPRPIWGVQVTAEDESDDLRKYLPVLVGASIEYIGRDSGGEIKTIKIDAKDPAIAFVKKGL